MTRAWLYTPGLETWLQATLDDRSYWLRVVKRAEELGSDGCSVVPSFYLKACLEHDVHYRIGSTLGLSKLSRERADHIFRRRIQQFSPLGKLSPMSWWRWAGVRLFGRGAWESYRT